MSEINIVKRVHHRWTNLFKLVLDVERYPAFVPLCSAVRLLSRNDSPVTTIIVSRMSVGFGDLSVSYRNRTVGALKNRQIVVEAIDGPMRYLKVVWRFDPGGDEWTKIAFSANYEFSNLILRAVASRVFNSMFSEIVVAFEQRADELFGIAKSRS